MSPQYPLRPHNHVIETKSERFFENSVPADWTINAPNHDYGVDLRVKIFERGAATPYEFLVQLKSSRESSSRDTEKITLRVATYNYLWNMLQVVLLVKYCEDVNEAYWLLLKDVPEPNQARKTFTIHLPKTNRLSTIDWSIIKNHVRHVSMGKLDLWRRANR